MRRLRSRSLPLVLALALGACGRPAPAPVELARDTVPGHAPDSSWVARATLYQVFTRDFSPAGTLQGVIDGLDRIAAAGANTIWLMPVHPIGVAERKGTLGSPYAVRDYLAVDPDLGTEADLRALVDSVHGRGMHLILGWVPNHTARDAAWVGAHPDWYVRDTTGAPSVPRDEKGQLTDWTDVAQLDHANPQMRAAMLAALRHWLADVGVDGFRMDVAGFVPDAFWTEITPALRAAVDRPILLLAEWGDPDMIDLGFDLIYPWENYERLKGVWRGDSAAALVAAEVAEAAALPPGGGRLRFTTNHDQTAWEDVPMAIFGGREGARAAFTAMALLPGRPMVYNGQEIEFPVRLRLFERDPIDWDAADGEATRRHYARVLELAATLPARAIGARELAPVATTAPGDVIAYRRGPLVVLVNARDRAVPFTVEGVALDGATDAFTGEATGPGQAVTLGPYGSLVLLLPGS